MGRKECAVVCCDAAIGVAGSARPQYVVLHVVLCSTLYAPLERHDPTNWYNWHHDEELKGMKKCSLSSVWCLKKISTTFSTW
jgi:hypothetical protein